MWEGTTAQWHFGLIMIFVGSSWVLDRAAFAVHPKGNQRMSMGGLHVQMSVRHKLEDAHLVCDDYVEILVGLQSRPKR